MNTAREGREESKKQKQEVKLATATQRVIDALLKAPELTDTKTGILESSKVQGDLLDNVLENLLASGEVTKTLKQCPGNNQLYDYYELTLTNQS